MQRRRQKGRSRGSWLAGALGCAIAIAGLIAGLPSAAAPDETGIEDGEEEPSLEEIKAEWQGRLRDLRIQEAQLVQTIELATKEYADSNRRNYRRSGVRHFHRTNANEARVQLAVVREKIARMFDEIVAAGGSLNWLYEVDDEPIDPSSLSGLGDYADDGRFGGKGAYAPEDAESEDADETAEEDPDDGRNPLYTQDVEEAEPGAESQEGDVPASPAEKPRPGFDYDLWRKDRSRYERDRAAERHLEPGDY